jgi:transposase
MYSKILALLVVTVNQKIRNAKTALETEEKAREIAALQGRICGWKKLINRLEDQFGSNIPELTDNEEEAPIIEGIETSELKTLHAEMEDITKSTSWNELLTKITENKEGLKEYLITDADNARDLYLSQAQQEGITDYKALFQHLTDELQRRNEELDFSSEAVPYEEPNEEEAYPAIPNNQLQLPAPEKRRRKKKGE